MRGGWLALALSVGALGACAHLPQARRDHASALARAAQSTTTECAAPCAMVSPWISAGDALAATGGVPRHQVGLLESGEDALLARVHLIRAARRSIDVQTYLFTADQSGRLLLDELLAAARRGVQVRVLVDQMFSLNDPSLIAALAGAHANFSLRFYNPIFGEAHTSGFEFGAGIVCCLRSLQRRMHGKLFLVDGVVGITGGRNYQNRYFDWDRDYDYRDREVLVAGPVLAAMQEAFTAFWFDRRSVPAAQLHDVATRLLTHGVPPLPAADYGDLGARVEALRAAAVDPLAIRTRLCTQVFAAGRVEYLADSPRKHDPQGETRQRTMSLRLHDLIAQAQHSVLLQTPYLVLSKPARKLFRRLRAAPDRPRVEISTNSLAATDAWPVYALSHKYKRTYLHDLKFRIWEYKPFPAQAPIDLQALARPGGGAPGVNLSEQHGKLSRGGLGSGANRGSRGPLPLQRVGVRLGLHAKSLVIDERIGVVGTHNFDPRSDRLNTEGALIVFDVGFAKALAAHIRRDMRPDNAWLIGRRAKPLFFSGLDYSLGKLFEHLPLFDIWPFRYATSYALDARCATADGVGSDEALAGLEDPARSHCWHSVGVFPEVDVPFKGLLTRLMTAFGAGLAPVL